MCKGCGILFTRNNPEQRLENRFIWFKKWILERQTFKTLSRDSDLSIDTLQRIFYSFLERSPKVKILKRSNVHLRLDATYFEQFCMLCYQDHEDGYTQLIRFSDGEHFSEIKEDLDRVEKLGATHIKIDYGEMWDAPYCDITAVEQRLETDEECQERNNKLKKYKKQDEDKELRELKRLKFHNQNTWNIKGRKQSNRECFRMQ